jgi:16S rRNA G966 N2-methylase RsmD
VDRGLAVLDEVPRSTVHHELSALRRRLPQLDRPPGLPKRGALRLRVHDDGRFTATDARIGAEMERAVAGWSGLEVSRRGGSLEVWLLRRRDEPKAILATKLSEGARQPDRGVLRPDICAALARVEPLRGARLVVDPFAGSGVIGEACLEAGAESVWLNDIKGTQRSGQRLRWTHEDFAQLAVPLRSVDAIVTDPPWGHFSEVAGGVEHLYARVGSVAGEWLRPGGAIVVLTGASGACVHALLEHGELALERDQQVLVNGRKARVIRARKAVAGAR